MKKTLYILFVLGALLNVHAQSPELTAVGTIPGQFAVSSTGAGTYTIPIECPPGINGMQPNISLVYNSQSGNDITGYGFGISAYSVVSRVGSSRYYDGKTDCVKLTSEDNLMLDGQRLILVSGNNLEEGAKYKTEVETFIDITFTNNYFVVKEKSGQTLYYRTMWAVSTESSTATLTWLLEYMADVNGNIVYYSYNFDNQTGEYVLESIKYSANIGSADNNGNLLLIKNIDCKNKIEFQYTNNRADTWISYVSGAKITKSKLLNEINVFSNNVLQRKYTMVYDYDGYYNKLKQIRVTAADGSQLNPTVIDWGNPNTPTLQDKSYTMVSDASSTDKVFFCDVDNDGNNEVIKPMKAGINNTLVHDAKCVVYKYNKTTNSLEAFTEFDNFEQHQLDPPVTIDRDIDVFQSDNDNDGIEDIITCKGEKYHDNKWYYTLIFKMSSTSNSIYYYLSSLDEKPLIMTGDFYPDGNPDIIINNKVYDFNTSTHTLDERLNLGFTPIKKYITDVNGNRKRFNDSIQRIN